MTKTYEEFIRWTAASDPIIDADPPYCFYRCGADFDGNLVLHAPDCWYTWCCEWVKAVPILEDLAKEAEGIDPDEAYDTLVQALLRKVTDEEPFRGDQLVCRRCGHRPGVCVCKQVTGAEPV